MVPETPAAPNAPGLQRGPGTAANPPPSNPRIQSNGLNPNNPAAAALRPTIHAGRQGKHEPLNTNFDPNRGRSELTHPDPQGLLNRGAGTGQMIRGQRGEAGSQEVVNFGEVIGIYMALREVEWVKK